MTDHRDPPQAPDWEPGIPSTWERCGPAWNLIYSELPHRMWFKATDVADAYVERTGLARSTIASFIRKAALAGILERRQAGPRTRIRYVYRRLTP